MQAEVRVGDLTRLGAGREAEIFEWEDDRVLRLAHDPSAAATVAREAAALEAARRAGAPVPALHEHVTVDGRPGVVMDRCDGGDLLARLRRRPWSVSSVGQALGRLHARLHDVQAPQELPALRARIAARLESGRVPDDVRDRALGALDELSDGDRLCHGDFHPANVLRGRRGQVVIDWVNATRGPPAADVARTCLLLMVGEMPAGTPAPLRRVFLVGRRLLLAAYLRSYRTARPLDLALVERWLPVCAAARLGEAIEEERGALLALAGEEDAGAGPRLPRRRPLEGAQRRWLLWNAVAITAVVNLVLNAGIAWLSVKGMSAIPLWSAPLVGGPSTITDTVGTFFLLPLITCVLITTAVRGAIAGGQLRPLGWADDRGLLLRVLPVNRLGRGVVLGALCVGALAPATVAVLVAADFGDLSVNQFVAYKAALGVTLGAFVTPVIALLAMADAPARSGGERRRASGSPT